MRDVQAELFDRSEAMICSFECPYCLDCANTPNNICNNCNGELAIRPKKENLETSHKLSTYRFSLSDLPHSRSGAHMEIDPIILL